VDSAKAFKRLKTLAAEDTKAALMFAKEIRDPRVRCLSLANVAHAAPTGRFHDIIEKALSAGHSVEDPYKMVTVMAWPVRALTERCNRTRVAEVLPELLERAETIEHPVSRLCVLFVVWNAVFPLAGEERRQVQEAFVSACRAANSWKAGQKISHAALILADESQSQALEFTELLREGRLKRQTMRRITAGQTEWPRIFF
jgi:hypothetical protein